MTNAERIELYHPELKDEDGKPRRHTVPAGGEYVAKLYEERGWKRGTGEESTASRRGGRRDDAA